MNDAIRMQISAFVDGELPDNESELLLRRLTQDPVLRAEAANYLAIGRVMRGQRVLPGMNELRGRIAAAIDNNEEQADFDAIEPVDRRLLRPVAGFAIAATVAVAALLGLQQINSTPEGGTGPVAEGTGPSTGDGYVVPEIYLEWHQRETSGPVARPAAFQTVEDIPPVTDGDAGESAQAEDEPAEDAADTGTEADEAL